MLTVVAALLIGQSPSNATPKTYTIKDCGFQIVCPTGWTLSETQTKAMTADPIDAMPVVVLTPEVNLEHARIAVYRSSGVPKEVTTPPNPSARVDFIADSYLYRPAKINGMPAYISAPFPKDEYEESGSIYQYWQVSAYFQTKDSRWWRYDSSGSFTHESNSGRHYVAFGRVVKGNPSSHVFFKGQQDLPPAAGSEALLQVSISPVQ